MIEFYNFFIKPIEFLYKIFFHISTYSTDNILISIFFLSIFHNVIYSPINLIGKKLKDQENEIDLILSPQIAKLKSNYIGQELHNKVSNLYKRYRYHPIYSLRNSLSLIFQIPFFIAAYQMLSHSNSIEKKPSFFISDLSQPDQLIEGINVLPIIMTLLSILNIFLFTRANKKEKKQLIIISFLFFILLYSTPSSLVLFWIFNNLIAIFKSVFLSNLFEKERIIQFFYLNHSSFFSNLSSLLILNLLFIFGITSLVFLFNRETFQFIDILIFLKIGLFLTICFTLFQLPLSFIPNFKFILSLAIFWILLTGTSFPLVDSTVMTNLQDIPINKYHFTILLIFITSIIYISYKKICFKIKFISYTKSISLILVFLSFSIYIFYYFKFDKRNEVFNFNLANNKNNVIVISFDGIPGKIIYDEILAEKESNYFKDFYLFKNILATSPATEASIMGEIYGVHKFKDYGNTVKQMTKNIESIYSKLIENNYDVYTYRSYNIDSNSKTYNLNPHFIKSNGEEISSLISTTFARIFSSTIYKNTFFEFSKIFYKELFLSLNLHQYDKNIDHHGADWDFQNINDLTVLNNLTSNLNINNSVNTAYFMHFVHSHFPVDLDGDCKYQSNNKEWHEKNQNE